MTNPYLDIEDQLAAQRGARQDPVEPQEPSQSTAPAPPPTPSAPYVPPIVSGAANPYLAVEEQVRQEQKTDTDREVKLLEWAAQSSLPPGPTLEVQKYAAAMPDLDPAFIAQNLDKVREKAKGMAQRGEFEEIVNEHPVLAKYLGDPAKAGMIIDDAASLKGLSENLRGKTISLNGTPYHVHSTIASWYEEADRSWNTLMAQKDRLLNAMGDYLSRTAGLPETSLDKYDRDQELKAYAQLKKNNAPRDLYGYLGPPGNELAAKEAFLDGISSPIRQLPVLMGTMGAIALGNAPGALGVLSTAGRAALAAGGAPAGSGTAAALLTNIGLAAPSLFDSLVDMKGQKGQQLTESQALWGTVIGAPLMGIAMTPVAHVMETTLSAAAGDAVRTAMQDASFWRPVGAFFAQWGINTLEAAVGMGAQSGVEAGIQELARHDYFGEEARPEVVAGAFWEGLKRGVVDMAALSAWGPGQELLRDFGDTGRVLRNHERFKAMMNQAADSKLLDRSAPEFKNYVKDVAAQSETRNIYIDKDALAAKAKELGVEPQVLSSLIMGDKGEAWTRLNESRESDLVVPLEQALSLSKKKGLSEFILDEGRFDQASESPTVTRKRLDEMITAITEEMKKPISPEDAALNKEVADVYDREFKKALRITEKVDQIRKAGIEKEVADQHARMVVAMMKYFQKRGKSGTLTEWYDKTFGTVGIWVDHAERILMDPLAQIYQKKYAKVLDPSDPFHFAELQTRDATDVLGEFARTAWVGLAGADPKVFDKAMYIRTIASPTTIAHEGIHAFAAFLWEHRKASPELEADHKLLTDALKAAGKETGNPLLETTKHMLGSPLSPHQLEEALSYMFEQYLQKGESPSIDPAIAKFFVRFKSWFRAFISPYRQNIPEFYKKHYGGLKPLELTPAVKEFLDKIFISDEVEQRTKILDATKIDPNIVKLLDDVTRKKYEDLVAKIKESATSDLQRLVAEAGRRGKTAFFKEKREQLIPVIRDRLRASMPFYTALEFLVNGKTGNEQLDKFLTTQSGPAKLSFKEIRERFGNHVALDLKNKHPEMFDEKSAIPVNDIAQVFNGTPADMINRLITYDKPETEITRRVDRLIRRTYGADIIDHPQQFTESMAGSLINEAMLQKVLIEMQALANQLDPGRQVRAKMMSKETAQRTVARLIENKSINDIAPGRILLQIERNAGKAQRLINEGKHFEAWDALEAQTVQIYLHREALKVRAEMEKKFDFLSNATRDSWRREIGLADPAYRNAYDAILEAAGVRQADPNNPVDAKQAMDGLIAIADAQGNTIAFDDVAIRDLLASPSAWNDLSVGAARNVWTAIVNIRKIAKNQNKITLEEKQADLAQIINDIQGYLRKYPSQGLPPASTTQETGRRGLKPTASSIHANSLDPKHLFEFMGPDAKRVVWDEYVRRRNYKFDLAEKILGWVTQEWTVNMPEGLKKTRFDVIPELDKLLPTEGVFAPATKDYMWLMMVMHNMGNEGNRKRLLEGFNWHPEMVMRAAEKYLTKEHMDWIQSNWRMMDKELYPLIKEKYERETGLPPEKVENTPFTMKFADGREASYEGGYFPAKYDPRTSAMQQARDMQSVDHVSYIGVPNYTANSFARSRSKTYSDIVNLDWRVFPSHVNEVLHDLAFGAYVKDMSKILLNNDMKAAMQEFLGLEKSYQPRAWLVDVAGGARNAVPQHLSQIVYGILGGLHSRVATAALGWSFTVAAADLLNPAAVIAAGRVTMRDGFPAWIQTLAMYPWMRDFARSRSKELPYRQDRIDQRMRRELLLIGPAGNVSMPRRAMDWVRGTAWFLMDGMDRLTGTATWMGKYREVMRTTGDEAKAIYEADSAVQDTVPTHNILEKPALLRDQRSVGSLLMFFGYFSKLYNMASARMHDSYMDFVEAEKPMDYVKAGYGMSISAGRVMAMLMVSNVIGDYFSGRGKEKDEDWGQWWERKSMAAPFALIPFGASIAEPAFDKLVTGHMKHASIRQAPALSMFQTVLDTMGKMTSDKRESDRKVWDAVELALTLGNQPARQPRRTLEYVTRLLEGKEDIRNPFDFVSGVGYGTRKNQPHTPFRDLADWYEEK